MSTKLSDEQKAKLWNAIAESDITDGALEHKDIDALVDLFQAWLERSLFANSEYVIQSARAFCEEVQEDGEGVPRVQLERLNKALDAYDEGKPLGLYDDNQVVLAALSGLANDDQATDKQRRTARYALAHCAALEAELKAAQCGNTGLMNLQAETSSEAHRLDQELKAAQEQRDEWKEMHDKLAKQSSEWNGYATRKVNDFRAQLVEAVRAMTEWEYDSAAGGSFQRFTKPAVIDLITTFEPK